MRYFAKQIFDGRELKTNQVITIENGKIITVQTATSDNSYLQLHGLVALRLY
ncbi:hypothetical protein RS130_14505 [Paraglaciecola aquimarina]|uniref:Uncharacterized protein n=1 Tax=Paraglaciecola aquimarina TaxID=1235557 RepID=A0ABU3SY67_9ALTE|nr:hypothetical protein [Paraglaciecola aquimarina]MDU0354960.1 hypothetical protein [Paraglaciecola aquimarina]